VVHGLEAEYFDKIDFVYLDIDDSRTDEFKRMFGYLVQPHIFLLDGEGNVIQQWLGIVPESEFRSVFDDLI
jgi:thioredoxin-related protein